jgi:hypothetical protein
VPSFGTWRSERGRAFLAELRVDVRTVISCVYGIDLRLHVKGSHVSRRILRVEKKRKIVLIFKDAAAYLPSRSCSVSTMRGHNRDFHAALAIGSR